MTKKEEKIQQYLEREVKRAEKAEECAPCGENSSRLHEITTVKAVISSILQEKPLFKVERLTETAKLPVKAHPTDAGWDIFADENVDLPAGYTRLVSTGLKFDIPEGWEIQVRSRGSMAMSGIIVANSPGTVDSGYRGEVKVLLMSMNDIYDGVSDLWNVQYIKKGQKIAQLIFAPTHDIKLVEGSVDQNSDRNSNGFGSTGK